MRFLVVLLAVVCQVSGEGTRDSCVTPHGFRGVCIPRSDCLEKWSNSSIPVKYLGIRQCTWLDGPLRVCCRLKASDPVYTPIELHEFGYQNATFHAVRQDRQMKKLTGKPWDELQEEDEKNTLGKPLGREDFDCALDVALIRPNYTVHNPMHVPGMIDGDMVKSKDRWTRAAVTKNSRLWPKAVVPYVISDSFTSYERAVIARAFLEIEVQTCLRLVPRTDESKYVSIIKGNGCYSYVGRMKTPQVLSLGEGCVYLPTVLHELMHTFGVYHEHSRADRDKYIKIAYKNIKKKDRGNFPKMERKEASLLKTTYNFDSVMHADAYAFSKNGKPTIYVRRGKELIVDEKIGHGLKLSCMDVKRLNLMYKCDEMC